MALKIAITDKKGIVAEYHMIYALKVTDRIEVTLKSYVNESYRQLEKDILDNITKKAELEQQLSAELTKETVDVNLINSIRYEMAELDTEMKDFAVGTMNYRIPFDKEDNISFTSIYEKLKKEATFEGSEDC